MSPRVKNPGNTQGKKRPRTKTSRSQPSPEATESGFVNSAAEERFLSLFAHRKVSPGRIIDFNFLESIQFPYLQTFRNFGWMDFLSLRGPYFENLIRIFYSNIDTIDEATGKKLMTKFSTSIKLFSFSIDEEVLGDLLEIPVGGVMYTSTHFNALEACKVVFKNPHLTEVDQKPVHLGMHERILHLIVSYNLNARSGRYSEMTLEDIWWMRCIIEGNRPNLLAWMISSMIKTCASKTQQLHYGYAISKILKAGPEEFFSREDTVEPHHSAWLSEATLRHMHYEQNPNEEWVLQRRYQRMAQGQGQDQPRHTIETDSQVPTNDGTQQASPQTSVSPAAHTNIGIMNFMQNSFLQVFAKIDAFETKMTTQIQGLTERVDNSNNMMLDLSERVSTLESTTLTQLHRLQQRVDKGENTILQYGDMALAFRAETRNFMQSLSRSAGPSYTHPASTPHFRGPPPGYRSPYDLAPESVDP